MSSFRFVLQYRNIVPSFFRARLSHRHMYLNMVLEPSLIALQEVKCFVRSQVSSWSLNFQFFSVLGSVQSLFCFPYLCLRPFSREVARTSKPPTSSRKKNEWKIENATGRYLETATSLKFGQSNTLCGILSLPFIIFSNSIFKKIVCHPISYVKTVDSWTFKVQFIRSSSYRG